MNEPSLQEQLLGELDSYTTTGQITVHEKDAQWHTLIKQRFPTRITGGISWDKVPGAQSNTDAVPDIPPEGLDGDTFVREHASAIRSFLNEFSEIASIDSHEKIILIGDGITDIAFEMLFETLLETTPIFFSYPQHTYIVKPDGSWCFVFKFECDMYYGKSSR